MTSIITETTPELRLQERVLAAAALRGIGDLAVAYTTDSHGDRIFREGQTLSSQEFPKLTETFQDDPKTTLAYLRQNLIAIGAENGNQPTRLDRYFDAYTDLTAKLDRAAFSDGGIIHNSVPDYVPDGFIDLGGQRQLDPMLRFGRDQIRVNKKAIYNKHRDTLIKLFAHDWTGKSSTEQKEKITTFLLLNVFYKVPYNNELVHQNDKESFGGVLDLHDLNAGVCRHQALTFQVLAQACGLTSRYVKCHMDGERHAANAVRINGKWHLVDTTNPDYTTRSDGRHEWKPSIHEITHEPRSGDSYDTVSRHSMKKHTYSIHDNMYWRIAPSQNS